MKHAISKRTFKNVSENKKKRCSCASRQGCNGPLYEKKWFWLCLTVIIICLTRPIKIVICGNSNGHGKGKCCANEGLDDQKSHK